MPTNPNAPRPASDAVRAKSSASSKTMRRAVDDAFVSASVASCRARRNRSAGRCAFSISWLRSRDPCRALWKSRWALMRTPTSAPAFRDRVTRPTTLQGATITRDQVQRRGDALPLLTIRGPRVIPTIWRMVAVTRIQQRVLSMPMYTADRLRAILPPPTFRRGMLLSSSSSINIIITRRMQTAAMDCWVRW